MNWQRKRTRSPTTPSRFYRRAQMTAALQWLEDMLADESTKFVPTE